MKKLISYTTRVFIFLFVAMSFTYCGEIKGGGPYEGGQDGRVIDIVGATFARDVQYEGELIRNAEAITFLSDGFVFNLKEGPGGNNYVDFLKGSYTRDGNRIECVVTWCDTGISGGKDYVGQRLLFNVEAIDRLRGPGGEVWRRI